MIAIRGIGSKIATALAKMAYNLDASEEVFVINRGTKPTYDADRYLICQGILIGKPRIQQTDQEIHYTYFVNYIEIVRLCDDILENNRRARICVLGSESGISGSYDETYSDSKFLLHNYVETKKLYWSWQQLVCVAPSIIEDSGMTLRRNDKNNLHKLEGEHPKRRFLSCAEVAEMIYFLLYVDKGYTTNTVVRMNGGKHCV
jgi:NAD(P)-dependent dehydrogenase (short-subunit alcohol dehydrogenase family)